MNYILDACTIIAITKQEQGHEIVESLINKAINNEINLFMHQINLLEVYKYISKYYNELAAEIMKDEIEKLPIAIIKDFNIKSASGFLIKFKVSIADSIALSTAQRFDAELVTADYHDMKQIEQFNPDSKFLWIR